MQFFKRWVTALILAPIVVLVILYGSLPVFFAVVLALIILCLYEYFSMLFRHSRIEKFGGVILGAALALAFYPQNPACVYGTIVIIFIVSCCYYIFRSPDINAGFSRLALMLTGILYIGFLLPHAFLMRNIEGYGIHWIFFTLIATFIADSSAAYVGVYLGKHKLYPRLSPGKTWEGFVGGCCGSIVAALACGLIFLRQVSVFHVLLLGVAIAVVGLCGDLFESMIKRSAGVKDSGSMLPGHGGWLDRLDAALFTLPFTYYYIRLFINGDAFL